MISHSQGQGGRRRRSSRWVSRDLAAHLTGPAPPRLQDQEGWHGQVPHSSLHLGAMIRTSRQESASASCQQGLPQARRGSCPPRKEAATAVWDHWQPQPSLQEPPYLTGCSGDLALRIVQVTAGKLLEFFEPKFPACYSLDLRVMKSNWSPVGNWKPAQP